MSKDIQIIEIPKWGLSMEEGTVNQWLLSEGDSFETGTELVEIESSKIINVVEASFSGTLRRIIASAGESFPVGTPIAVAADISVSDADIDTFLATASPGQVTIPATEAPTESATISTTASQPARCAESAPTTTADNTQVPDSLKQGDDDSKLHATLHARHLASQLGINLHQVTPTGRNNRISKHDVEIAITTAGGTIASTQRTKDKRSTSHKDDSQVSATPVARRLARQLGINLHDCRASGSRGRVAKADVESAHLLATGNTSNVPTKGTKDTPATVGNPCEAVPMDGMRKVIATRLQQSKQTAPHFRLTVDVDIDSLLAIRKRLNASNTQAKVSVNDFVIKAAATALLKVPDCNVQFDGSTITRFADADISVAVALDGGLITPIVRAANSKGLMEISNEVRTLVTRAKAGTLMPNEFQGGTFSISNLGMYGIKQFDAIINPPQGSILAVGSGEQRVVVKDGAAAVVTIMTLTLSSDHRVIDGALGAVFLQALKTYLEDPAMMVA